MNNLVLAFSQFGKLSSTSINELTKIVKEHHLPKGHILVTPDSVCKHFYFVERGLTRTFYIKEGKDITDWISPEGTFSVSLISYINQVPDRRGIELLEDSVLHSLYNADLEDLCARFHDIEHIVRLIVNHGIIQMQRKIDDSHFSTAKQRYENLVASNSSIIQRVPLGMVASLLGITQETLSRVRAQK